MNQRKCVRWVLLPHSGIQRCRSPAQLSKELTHYSARVNLVKLKIVFGTRLLICEVLCDHSRGEKVEILVG